MPTKIRVLSDQTINEIAAGEVIENPSSVVKELVENSIDAGATEITIEIRGGGRQLIRITDNGCGMGPDDALLCLERHATSKIRSSDDIFAVGTLGFRGEAIPSIASISKFTLLTRPEEAEQGTLVVVDGGKLVSTGPAARSQGTTIEVKQLFFNVPVRKKFQRSPAYDAQEIEKICISFAMAHPDIHFHLISNDETAFKTSSSGLDDPLGSRIENLLGHETWEQMRRVEVCQDGFTLKGYVGTPSLHRPNRTGQFLFVNGRTIVSPLISHLVKENYGTLLPSNRHPVFVLSLTLPSGNVDVNVHPQKREVRFAADCCLRELVQAALNNSLFANTLPTEEPAIFQEHNPLPPPSWTQPVWLEQESEAPATKPPKSAPIHTPLPWDNLEPPKAASTAPVQIQAPLPIPQSENKPTPRLLAILAGYLLLDGTSLQGTALQPFQKMEECAFALVDQRRAHHRVIYEQLANTKDLTKTVQPLLIPHTLHISLSESQLLQNHQEKLQNAGVDIRPIGPQTWIVEALPSSIGNVDVPKFIDMIIESLRRNDDGDPTLVLATKLSSAAIASTLTHTRKLTHEEGLSLLQQLCRCKQPLHCPNGKSIFVTLSHNELQKRFN